MKAGEVKCPKCGAVGLVDVAPDRDLANPFPDSIMPMRSVATQGQCANGHLMICGTGSFAAPEEFVVRVFELREGQKPEPKT